MEFFKNLDWSIKSILKVLGVFVIGMIIISIAMSLVSMSLDIVFNRDYNDKPYYRGEPDLTSGSMMMNKIMPTNYGSDSLTEVDEGNYGEGAVDYENEEDLEIKEYNGRFTTRKLDDVCGQIMALKEREDIIFTSSNNNEKNCYYKFKVQKDKEEEIVTLINDIGPDYLNHRIYTIAKTISNYDSELDILKKQLASIDDTLNKAQNAYDELSRLATNKQDVETLARIIDNKLKLISELSKERLRISNRIERYNKYKSEQLEKVNYIFFTLNVYEDLYFDFDRIKKSWKQEISNFVDNLNSIAQDLTVNLVHYFLRFIQASIYLLLSIFLLKFVWILGKKVWKRE